MIFAELHVVSEGILLILQLIQRSQQKYSGCHHSGIKEKERNLSLIWEISCDVTNTDP